jgi:hypothetical protein
MDKQQNNLSWSFSKILGAWLGCSRAGAGVADALAGSGFGAVIPGITSTAGSEGAVTWSFSAQMLALITSLSFAGAVAFHDQFLPES